MCAKFHDCKSKGSQDLLVKKFAFLDDCYSATFGLISVFFSVFFSLNIYSASTAVESCIKKGASGLRCVNQTWRIMIIKLTITIGCFRTLCLALSQTVKKTSTYF